MAVKTIVVNKTTSKSTGHKFERDAKSAFYAAAYRTKHISYEDVTDEEDRLAGTDFIYEGYRVDVTYHFSGKNNTTYLTKQKSFIGADLKIGIRTGNGVVKFDDPVIVIGFDLPCEKDVKNLISKDLISDAYANAIPFINSYLNSDEFLDAFDIATA